jgi:tetratricopeptide (TPR) repeat protein
MLSLSLTGLPARADVTARITYDKNSIADVVNPAIRNNAVVLAQGTLPLSRISRMDFEFGTELTAGKCAGFFKEGKFDQLEKLLTAALNQAEPFMRVPGNLDVYLTWQMKVQFWNGRYTEMRKTADLLRQRTPSSFDPAGMYTALALIDQDQADGAGLVFAAVDNAEAVSAPMAFFVRARLAMVKREYREALQLLARIVALHGKDPEWMPAATLYEGLVYKRIGYLEAAGNVAEELTEIYPDGYWGRRAGELK